MLVDENSVRIVQIKLESNVHVLFKSLCEHSLVLFPVLT